MALTLGNPNLPGNAQYVRNTGRALLLCLLPYYALGIADGWFLPALVRHPPYFWSYDLAKFIVAPAVYLLIFSRYFHVRRGDYFFTGQRIGYRGWEWLGVTLLSAIILDVVFLFACPFALFAYSVAVAALRWAVSSWFDLPALSLQYAAVFDYGLALPDDRVLRAIVAIFFAITAGVVEEIFFRGLFRQAIAALLGPRAVKTYIISSSLVFGLAHWEQGAEGLIGATAFGACAAWLYLKLGDLRPLILAHAAIDLYIYW